MSNDFHNAYATTSVLSSDPVTLVTMLFDGAVKAMKKAQIYHETGNRKGFLDETNRAQLIVGELLSSLDMEQGEIPAQLSGIYAYCIRCLIESSIDGPALVAEAEKHISRVSDAWKLATAALREATAPLTAAGVAA